MICIVTAYEALKNFRKLIEMGVVGWWWGCSSMVEKNQPRNNKAPLSKSPLILIQIIYPYPSWQSWDQAAM